MSVKEVNRVSVMAQVKAKALKLAAAAVIMSVSYRQVKRIWKRYQCNGAKGIVHQSRGKISPRRYDETKKRAIIERYKNRYSDFGCVFACEKLSGDGHQLSDETLRRWLIKAGLWQRKRKRPKHRSRREPKAHFGEMLQIDGSFHAWYEQRNGGAHTCLMVLVDDATGTTMAFMSDEETTLAALTVLKMWIERYGIPRSLYCDKKNMYLVLREATVKEQIAGIKPLSSFGKACKILGIEIIPAHSPQAKGRVERKHGVFQDRFLKELRLENINSNDAANTFLCSGYLNSLNTKFAHPASHPEDWHRPLANKIDLKKMLCVKDDCVLSNDWIVRHDNRFYQVSKNNYPLPPPRAKIVFSKWTDGSTHLLYKDSDLDFIETDPHGRSIGSGVGIPPKDNTKAAIAADNSTAMQCARKTKAASKSISRGGTSMPARPAKAPQRASVSKVFSRNPWNFSLRGQKSSHRMQTQRTSARTVSV